MCALSTAETHSFLLISNIKHSNTSSQCYTCWSMDLNLVISAGSTRKPTSPKIIRPNINSFINSFYMPAMCLKAKKNHFPWLLICFDCIFFIEWYKLLSLIQTHHYQVVKSKRNDDTWIQFEYDNFITLKQSKVNAFIAIVFSFSTKNGSKYVVLSIIIIIYSNKIENETPLLVKGVFNLHSSLGNII